MQDPMPRLAVLARRLLSAIKGFEKAILGQVEAVTEAAKVNQTIPPEVMVRAELTLPHGVEIRKSATDALFDRKYQRRTLLLSWFTLIAILAYAAISAWQLCEMRKANKISDKALESVQRAFIYFSDHLNPLAVIDPKDKTRIDEFQFTVPMENSGATQAVGLVFRARTYPSQGELSDSFSYPDDEGKPLQLIVLGPKGNTVSQPVGVSPEVVRGVQDRLLYPLSGSTEHLYFYGWARYWDIFENRNTDPPHITEFCYELTGINGTLTIPEVTAVQTFFTDCPHHNCTDEDCKAEKPN
jgi:hypothetical protein